MNKSEAAKMLGVKERTVERYVRAGKLTKGFARGKTGQVLDLDDGELQRLKAELEAPTNRATTTPDSSDNTRQEQPRQGAPSSDSKALAVLDGTSRRAVKAEKEHAQSIISMDGAALLRALVLAATSHDSSDKARQAPTVPVADKPLLTLAECSALCGYSVGKLKEAFDQGALPGHRDGRVRRVRRADLDAWITKL